MAQDQALALAAALHASGRFVVRLCCPADAALARQARERHPELTLVPLSAPGEGLALWRLFRIWRCQRRGQPLLIHAFDPQALQLGWRLSRLRRPGSTLLAHSCFFLPEDADGSRNTEASGTSGPMPLEAENRAWQAVDEILCANATLHAQLAASGLPPTRLAVVHPGCRTAALPPRQPRKDGRFVFVAVEELCVGSGLFVLLRAMAALWQRTDLPLWEVRVVGTGPALSALLGEARSLGVESRLALLSQQDLAEVLPRCDALLVPCRQPSGNMAALMAAWCCHLPLVCTDVPAHKEVVRADETALCVPPGDAQALAAAMIQLVGDPALCARLTAQGADMRPYADHARMVAQTLARYEQGLACSTGRGEGSGLDFGWTLPPAPAAPPVSDCSPSHAGNMEISPEASGLSSKASTPAASPQGHSS